MGNKKSFQALAHEDEKKRCPECGSKNLEYQKGELICKNCSLVIE